MAAMLGAPIAPSLEEHWRVLLRNQFHDIIPGSSIREVYETAETELGKCRRCGRRPLSGRISTRSRGRSARAERNARCWSSTPTCRHDRCASLRAKRSRVGRKSKAAALSPPIAPVPALSAAVILEGDLGPPAGLAVGADFLENRFVPCGTLARWHAEERLRQACGPRMPCRPRQSDPRLCRQAAAVRRLGHRGGLCRSKRGDRRVRHVPRSSNAVRIARRSASSANSATARSRKRSGCGQTRRASNSRPTSTGTIGGFCSKPTSRSPYAPRPQFSNARTGSSAARRIATRHGTRRSSRSPRIALSTSPNTVLAWRF